ncbi:MAG: ImmA/IrrE family metallo-endopeptidase [Acidimicrobiales bacterium]|nr:ImmA/IrrE family metallo-endopeptidase [Acidimicrobiales bacterium]
MGLVVDTPTVDGVARALVAALDPSAAEDLRAEDPASAIEVHFGPVRVRTLELGALAASECSTDGFYDASTSLTPTILYDDGVSSRRARFTLIHELGHHLLATTACELVDAIDDVAGDRWEPAQVEERVCHAFAGRVLVSDELLETVLGRGRLAPDQLVELHKRSDASWEAAAVRAAGFASHKVVVALVRERGAVAFCAASGLELPWWPRGSKVAPGGPLDRSLVSDHKARPERFRAGLGFEEQLYCDSRRVHERLAVAVLTDTPSDGSLNIPEEVEPAWKSREDFCASCNEVRDTGWCDTCNGRFCPVCERCGCFRQVENEMCPGCGTAAPRRPDGVYCLTCEADGLG